MAKKKVKSEGYSNVFVWVVVVGLVVFLLYSQTSYLDFLKENPEEEQVDVPDMEEELQYSGGGGGSRPPVQPDPVVFDWCYQESPDVVNQTGIDGNCGLLYGGHVMSGNESLWINYSNLNDGDWDTYAVADESAMPWAEISIMYEKPPGALPNSLFQHKHDNFVGDISDPATVEFMEIPLSCWEYNEDYLIFTAVSRTNTSESAFKYSAFHCFNGTHYPTMTSLTLNAHIYEDAMWWAFPEGYLEQFNPLP